MPKKKSSKSSAKSGRAKKQSRAKSPSRAAKSTRAKQARSGRSSTAAKSKAAKKPELSRASAAKGARNKATAPVKNRPAQVAKKSRTTPAPARKTARQKSEPRRSSSSLAAAINTEPRDNELETNEAGQSGDISGLPTVADADSESVEELVAEAQDYEAELIDGVERAADEEEHEVPRDERSEDSLLDDDAEFGGSE